MVNSGFPPRLFREGAEPNGERVHSYAELSYIDEIVESLLPDERKVLQNSQFGKFLEIPQGPAYSGKLIHFLLTRQLVVKKKHEIWVIFGGSPIRFSLSEFGYVTGLNCTKPEKPKKKPGKRCKVLPGKYWYTLFDNPNVSVEWVLNRLKKKLVTNRDMRLRYAMLALVDGVLCPTSGNRKICPTHVDLSEDIEKFLNYPWGTTAFDMTLTSIQARGAKKLKGKSTTVQGFPHALQLLLLEVVPHIKELHFPAKDEDDDSEVDDIQDDINRLWTLKLDLVWKIDGKSKCSVTPLLDAPAQSTDQQAEWSDDEDDGGVTKMLQCIKKGKKFNASLFTGGLLPDEVPDDGNDNSDDGSNDHFNRQRKVGKKIKTASSSKATKGNDKPNIPDAFKQFVHMQVKRSENRVLKALAEAEVRLSNSITKATSKSKKFKPQGEPVMGGSLRSNSIGGPSSPPPPVVQQSGTNDVRSVTEATVRVQPQTNEVTSEYGISPSRVVNKIMSEVDEVQVSRKRNVPSPMSNNTQERRKSKRSCSKTSRAESVDNQCDGTFQNMSPAHAHSNVSVCQTGLNNNCDESGGNDLSHNYHFGEAGPETSPLRWTFRKDVTQHNMETKSGDDVSSIAKKLVLEDEAVNFNIENGLPNLGEEDLHAENKAVDAEMIEAIHEEQAEESMNPAAQEASVTVEPNQQLGTDKEVSKGMVNHSTAIVLRDNSGDDVLQLQKIIRITTPERLIDFGGGRIITSSAVTDIIDFKTDLSNKEMDIIFNAIRQSWEDSPPTKGPHVAAFRDSTFGTSLLQHYQKFRRSSDKGMYAFDTYLNSSCPTGFERFYFSYTFDKRHWVCLCVDLEEWTINVLDCFTSAWRESRLKTQLQPLSKMLPYLARMSVAREGMKGVKFNPLGIYREKGIPQACVGTQSGIMAATLGEAHALGGFDLCKVVQVTELYYFAKKYIIDGYEQVNGPA